MDVEAVYVVPRLVQLTFHLAHVVERLELRIAKADSLAVIIRLEKVEEHLVTNPNLVRDVAQ